MNTWKSYKDIKICVYAIAADEPEAFIDRWLESMKGADYITVLVTKKDNPNTEYFLKKQELEEFKNKLIVKEQDIKPWRFDVARNESMKLIPKDTDACICTDIDEILIEDFWDDYRKCVFEHPDFDTILYRYAWSTNDDGTPNFIFWYDKTHLPASKYWEYPVHETLARDYKINCSGEYRLDKNKIYLIHLPDNTKNRSSYLKLLELRIKENPKDLQGLYLLAREYIFIQDYRKSLAVATYLYVNYYSDLDTDEFLLPSILNMIGGNYTNLGYNDEAEFYFKKAIEKNPTLREAYINLAQQYAYTNKPNQCIKLIDEMLQNTVYKEDWRLSPICWRNWKIYQILGDAYMWLNQWGRARAYFLMAVEDIVTETDKQEALRHNFNTDLEFLNSKLKEIEQIS